MNNHKEWFDANRDKYEAAKEDFAGLVKKIIATHGKKDETIAGLTPKECVFRINRDIRFSKDKTPYKTNFGASLNRGGKKSVFAGYYFHCDPGGNESFAGGGMWMPEPDALKKIRQEIDYSFDEFKKIITHKQFVSVYKELYKGEDATLSREPKGYGKDNPAIEFIKLKSYIAMHPLTEEDLTSSRLIEKISTAYTALQPLVEFINRAVE